jgi:DNA-binding CsgD family transcriptional regulator
MWIQIDSTTETHPMTTLVEPPSRDGGSYLFDLLNQLRAVLHNDSVDLWHKDSCGPTLADEVLMLLQANRDRGTTRSADLSRREQEVLAAIVTGSSNREIGESLFISANTVRFHVRGILRKLGVGSRCEAAVWAANNRQFRSEELRYVTTSLEQSERSTRRQPQDAFGQELLGGGDAGRGKPGC